MGVISLDYKVFYFPAVDAAALFPCDFQLGERSRLALQLCSKSIDVVNVDVCVSHDVGKGSRYKIADVSEHVSQQCVARNVERDAKAHVAGSLI